MEKSKTGHSQREEKQEDRGRAERNDKGREFQRNFSTTEKDLFLFRREF